MFLLARFILLTILAVTSSFDVMGREAFEFKVGDKVSVLSDKAYRKTQDNMFEAVGNVVITQGNKALYGEKASISMETGDVNVVGNVRYITSGMTLHGSKLDHNFRTDSISVCNAKVISDDFVVNGKKLLKYPDGKYFAEEAEYTTCRDCPESWSIFGKEIYITPGEYIKIHHGYFKINGVIVMYIPYIIFPIKTKRETGLLFPKFGFGLENNEGIRYQQPWYWAIGPHNDLTIVPSVFGKRGWGNDFQYRHVFGEQKWLEFNSLQAMDRIYEENKRKFTVSNHHYFRHFTQYEHQFLFGYNWNHHLLYNDVRELDILRDFESFSSFKVQGTELGLDTFIDGRSEYFNFGVEGYFNKNVLQQNAREFDHDYVQILPRLTVGMEPITLLHTKYPLIKNIMIGGDADYTVFKQNHHNEDTFIRNANRINATPYIDWQLGGLGPLRFKTNIKLDYQSYDFPHENRSGYDNFFSKQGMYYESEMSFELEKIFGVAYIEKKAINYDELSKIIGERDGENSSALIGSLPKYFKAVDLGETTTVKKSYRHVQEFKLKHYYLADQEVKGSSRFYQQIQHDDGLFDHVDAVREKINELDHIEFVTDLPRNNTVELQWNSVIIEKTPKGFDQYQDGNNLRQNFNYSEMAYFKLSQGYDLHTQADEFHDALTRLFIGTGLNLGDYSISFSEYYFYSIQKHIMKFNFKKTFSLASLGVGYSYNSLVEPRERAISFDGSWSPVDTWTFKANIDYDLDSTQSTAKKLGVLYSPRNNCWSLNVTYQDSLVGREYAFDFLINYNKNNFISIF